MARVSRTYLALWSQRGATVTREDILPGDPLRVVLVHGDIPLQTRVVTSSREQIELASEIVEDQVILSFLFLDPGDGGIVEVLHQGKEKPSLRGTIKGARIRQSPSTVDLNQTSIGWMSNPRWIARLRERWRQVYPRRATATGAALLLFPIAAVLAIILIRGFHPVLVSVNDYNLQTLQGQYDFSRKVADVGLLSAADRWFLVGLAIVNTLALAGLVYMRMRQGIPRSVAANHISVDPAATAALPPGPRDDETKPETTKGPGHLPPSSKRSRPN